MTALLTKKEVAAHLRVSTRTVENYCREGKLPFIQLKGMKRFRENDILFILANRYVDHRLQDKPRT